MIKNSHLLIDETPTTFQKSLAKTIGLNAAIFLQQLQFWTKIAEQRRDPKNYFDGRWWMQASYSEWAEQYFPFWSAEMIKRIVFYLEREQRIIIGRADSNSSKGKWYAIDYAELERLDILPPEANAEHAVELESEKEQITPAGIILPLSGTVEDSNRHKNSARRLPSREILSSSTGQNTPPGQNDPGQNTPPGQNDPGSKCPLPPGQNDPGILAKSDAPLKELKELKRDSKDTEDSGRALDSPPATLPIIPPVRRTGLFSLNLPTEDFSPVNSFAADKNLWQKRISDWRASRKQEER